MNEPNNGKQTSTEAVLETIIGSKEIEVTLTDGTKQSVTIRKISIRQMQKLLNVMQDDRGRAALYTDKPLDFVDQLDDDSFLAVLKEGRLLNFSRFENWYAEQKALLKALGVLQDDGIIKAATAAMEKAAMEGRISVLPTPLSS